MKIILLILLILIIYITQIYTKKKEDFNIYCNEKNDDKYDFFSKNTLIDKHLNKINTDNLPKYIYKSDSMIPYNYTDNLDRNIIYNLNIKKKIEYKD